MITALVSQFKFSLAAAGLLEAALAFVELNAELSIDGFDERNGTIWECFRLGFELNAEPWSIAKLFGARASASEEVFEVPRVPGF